MPCLSSRGRVSLNEIAGMVKTTKTVARYLDVLEKNVCHKKVRGSVAICAMKFQESKILFLR